MSGGGGPRQKMINLLYVVYIGMIAMNVSGEVLKGYAMVENGLMRSIVTTSEQSTELYNKLTEIHAASPAKARISYEKATDLRAKTQELTDYLDGVKKKIAVTADLNPDADPENLVNRSDLNAATAAMIAFPEGGGEPEEEKFLKMIEEYRTYAGSLLTDDEIKSVIDTCLSTEPSAKAKETHKTWTESLFEHMPAAAVVVMVTQLKYSVIYAEQLVMRELLRTVDSGDFRVNKLTAFVIPEAQVVMRGGTYKANVVIAAVDSAQEPKITVNGKELPEEAHGQYSVPTSTTGTFPLKGFIEMISGDGNTTKLEFATEYVVTEPSATIAPLMMNILYAGIANDVKIAVPGAADANVTANISAGTLTNKGNGIWSAVPKLGAEAFIGVQVKIGNKQQEVAKNTFRVRPLPPPTAFLNVTNPDGNKTMYKGGPLAKNMLLGTPELSAAIDDGILNIPFTVLGFEVQKFDAMGFAIKETSEGAKFSKRQQDLIRSMTRGQTILIRAISTKGPDGVTQTLNAPIEILVT
ncbi:gliding motility protein GldM [Bacteroidia bacterium]|nr:gliding motility protein GldM [Bacteroidia bacterium]